MGIYSYRFTSGASAVGYGFIKSRVILKIKGTVAKKLNITTATLYPYVNGDGSLRERGKRLVG